VVNSRQKETKVSITCGKKARKGGGNRHDIKRSWRRGGKEYRDSAERRQQHAAFEAGKVGTK